MEWKTKRTSIKLYSIIACRVLDGILILYIQNNKKGINIGLLIPWWLNGVVWGLFRIVFLFPIAILDTMFLMSIDLVTCKTQNVICDQIWLECQKSQKTLINFLIIRKRIVKLMTSYLWKLLFLKRENMYNRQANAISHLYKY